jgi:hypothetical protein
MPGPFNGSKTPAQQYAISAHTDALFYKEDPDKIPIVITSKNKNRKTVKRPGTKHTDPPTFHAF